VKSEAVGMADLRDLLKMLKQHHTAHPAHPMPSFGSIQASTSSLTSTTNSSSEMYLGYSPLASDINHVVEGTGEKQPRRRTWAETSVGPELSNLLSLVMPSSLFDSNPLPIRQSRGRPSLAAIFRIPTHSGPITEFQGQALQYNQTRRATRRGRVSWRLLKGLTVILKRTGIGLNQWEIPHRGELDKTWIPSKFPVSFMLIRLMRVCV
jgi:hypothetical protein